MKITPELAQSILDYLVRQPYADVHLLIQGLILADAESKKDTKPKKPKEK